jgi:hypothetical protein
MWGGRSIEENGSCSIVKERAKRKAPAGRGFERRSVISLKGDAKGSHKIVLRHRVRRHRDLVAGADDEVDRPSRRVVADREAAENEAGREQDLGEADVLPV